MRTNIPKTTAGVLHDAVCYDVLLWLATFGKERAFREKILQLASLAPGEKVLDVGCGTGTLAIAAKRHVGESGLVYGIDASPEMIARSSAKARKARIDIMFERGIAEALPFPDATFDVVLSTIMLHHLPRKARLEAIREMRRVLRPEGRILAVDFEGDAAQLKGILAHFHPRRHGHVKARDLIALFEESGLRIIESGEVKIRDLYFVLAAAKAEA